jgi:DnaK suppressor protein
MLAGTATACGMVLCRRARFATAVISLGESITILAPGAIMNSKVPIPDKTFLQRQRQRLTMIREELLRTTQAEKSEETEIHSHSLGEAHEYEDDAQKLAMLEIDGTVVAVSRQRLAQVERALQKIEDGTYGFSDASGEAIPRERLEAMPEAIYTLSELNARETDVLHATASKKV